jgi:sugar/nucleoside kinase (ribokinase family)
MKVFDVVTIGSALKDIMFYSGQLEVLSKTTKSKKVLAMEYGAKIPIDNIYVNYGGGALNVAVGLKNFGFDVAPLINLGNDMVGKEIVYHLKKSNIDTSLVNVDNTAKTGFSLVISAQKDKEHTIFTYKGASSNLNLPSLRGFRTKWFYVSALSNKNWATQFEKIAGQTRRNIKIAWNPGLVQLKDAQLIKKFLPFIEVLILNEQEANDLVGALAKKGKNKKITPATALVELQMLGANNVIITRGAKGVVAIDIHKRKYSLMAKADVKRIVDTVGAGDSFGSGFLAGWLRWLNFEKALWLGQKNATQNLYKIGAQEGLLKIKL